MRRTQLYLEDDLWTALHSRARSQKTTISDLVRRAARERYLGSFEERREAMNAVVGISANRRPATSAEKYIRGLRRGSRLEQLEKPSKRESK